MNGNWTSLKYQNHENSVHRNILSSTISSFTTSRATRINNQQKRHELARKFYDAEDKCYNIEERELYEYLNGCADPIKHSDYIAGDEYIQFLQDIIKTFNDVLPDKISVPKIARVKISKP